MHSLSRLCSQKLLRLLGTSFMAGKKIIIKVKFSSTFSGKYLVTGVILKTSQSTWEALPCLADLGLAFCHSDRKLHALSWLSWRLHISSPQGIAMLGASSPQQEEKALPGTHSSRRQPLDAQESGGERPCLKCADFGSKAFPHFYLTSSVASPLLSLIRQSVTVAFLETRVEFHQRAQSRRMLGQNGMKPGSRRTFWWHFPCLECLFLDAFQFPMSKVCSFPSLNGIYLCRSSVMYLKRRPLRLQHLVSFSVKITNKRNEPRVPVKNTAYCYFLNVSRILFRVKEKKWKCSLSSWAFRSLARPSSSISCLSYGD